MQFIAVSLQTLDPVDSFLEVAKITCQSLVMLTKIFWLYRQEPEIFQARGDFEELRHFDKHFVQGARKKRSHRESFFS